MTIGRFIAKIETLVLKARTADITVEQKMAALADTLGDLHAQLPPDTRRRDRQPVTRRKPWKSGPAHGSSTNAPARWPIRRSVRGRHTDNPGQGGPSVGAPKFPVIRAYKSC
jgi:hypothetical protein